MRRRLEWLGLAAIGLTALSIAAVQAPAPLRRFVLFPATYGALAGWGLARVGRLVEWSPTRGRWSAVALVLAGQLAASYGAWRRDTDSAVRRLSESVASAVLARGLIEQTAPPEEPDARAKYDELLRNVRVAEDEARQRLAEERPFAAHLKRRVRPLGDWRTPWPELFWAGEVALACAVGAWVYGRGAPPARGDGSESR